MRKFAASIVVCAVTLLGGAASSTVNADASQKPTTKPAPVMVTVQAGDTLSAIANAHNTTYVRIFDANSFINDPNVIDVGWQVRIPSADEQLPNRPLPEAAAPAVAPVATPAVSAPTVSAAVSHPVVSSSLGGGSAKAFIYGHESGNNPSSTSPSGCYGLGQDCSGRVRAQCGADYACQDAYFTSYALSRYGSWEAAAAFWQTHGWW